MTRKVILCVLIGVLFIPGFLWANTIFRLSEDISIPTGTNVDEVVVLHGSADIAGRVANNVIVILGSVTLEPKAQIGGDVICLGGKITSTSEAVVEGTKVEIGGQIGWRSLPFFLFGKLLLWGFLYKVAASVIMLALAMFIILMWPNQIFIAAEEASDDLVKSSLVGVLAVTILIPLAIGFAVTLFGLPISIALFLFLLVAYWFGAVTSAYLIGHKMLNKYSPLATVMIGFFVLVIVHFVPFMGGMLYFIAMLPGIGSIILTRFGTDRPWLAADQQNIPRPRALHADQFLGHDEQDGKGRQHQKPQHSAQDQALKHGTRGKSGPRRQ